MASLLDTGAVKQIDLITSFFFSRTNRAIFDELVLEFGKRQQRVALSISHCKVVTFKLEDGRAYVLQGSANLRSNRSTEQFSLTQSAGVHQFFDSWMNEIATKAKIKTEEVNETNDSQKS